MARQNVVSFPPLHAPPPQSPPAAPSEKPKANYILGYWIALFSLAALLILLSWFSISQRRSQIELDEAQEQHAVFSASVMENMLLLQRENEMLRDQVQADADIIAGLLREMEALSPPAAP